MVSLNYFFPNVTNKVQNIEKLRGKKVLVTGASGLIGNHILATLHDIQADIYILKFNSLPFFKTDYKIIQGWKQLEKDYNFYFDYIFHFAGYGQPARFSNNKFSTVLVNTQYLYKLFKSLERDGSILFASTSEIYSGLNGVAFESFSGNTEPNHPRASYIESKRCGEALIHALNSYEYKNFTGKIARIALAYGPGVRYDDTRVMSDFIRMGLEKGFIQPRGGLKNVRTYCYVSDTVEMLFNILLNGKSTVYNVGGNSSVIIEELACKVSEKLNIPLNIFAQKDIKDGAPNIVDVSIDRYENEFGKMKFTDFDEGLNKTIEWFRYLKRCC